jgi:hypothetical protein
MTDPMKQAWSDVEQRLSTLGQAIKEHYRAAGDDEPDVGTTVGSDREAGAALKGAFDRLVAAVREVGERAADVARDDDVKAQARQAAASLNDALSATVNMIGEQVGGLFKRSDKKGSEPAGPTAPPAGASIEAPPPEDTTTTDVRDT